MKTLFKRGVAYVLTLSMLMSLLFTTAFASGNAFQTTAANTVKAGDTFTVSFTQPTTLTMSSVGLKITFDKSAFEITEIANAPFAAFQPSVSGCNNSGNVAISYTDASMEANTQLPAGTVLLSITFRVRDTATAGEKTFTVADYNVSGNYISQSYSYEDITPECGSKTLNVEVVSELTGTLAITGVTAPVKNQAPVDKIAVNAPANTTITALSWSPAVNGTFAGETAYTATLNIKANSGYVFADGVAFTVDGENWTAEKQNDGSYDLSKTFPTTAGKDDPTCVAPAGVEAIYGQKLSEISLVNPNSNTPGTWSWMDGTQSVGDVGTRTFKARFTPNDTANYQTVENIDVSVAVGAKNITVTIADIADQEYTGSQLKPTVTVTGDNKTLVLDTDYTVDYGTNINVGTNAGSVTVKAKAGSNYTFSNTSKNFNIVAKAGQVTISGDLNVTYGTEVPNVTIDKHGSTGTTTVYYYTNEACTAGETTTKPTTAGNYWVKVKMAADANYGAAESNVIGFTIARKDISEMTVTLSATTKEYNGSSQSVTVSSVGTLTVSDYDVSGTTSATNVGDYTVTVTGKGNYTGTANAIWKITPKTVTSAMIASVDSQPYTGSAITPQPAITDGSALTENTDFTYSYEANTYVGTATVKITGKGNYTGTASKTFQITPVNQTPAITATANVTKGGNTLDLKTLVSNAQGTVSFAISGNANGCSITDGILTSGANIGTVKITVNITAKNVDGAGADEYNSYTGTEAITVTIVDKQSASLTVSQTGCTYGETLVAPTYNEPAGTTSTVITYNGTLDKGGSYSSMTPPTEAGTYTVNVKCETATHIYEGTSASFTIAPKSISGMTITLSATELEYTGSAQSISVTGVTGLDVSDYDVSGVTSGTNVGQYTVTVTGKGNYTGTANAVWKITPKAITISAATATNRGYVKDDKSVVISGVTFAGASLTKDTDYTVTGVMDDANAGNGKTVNVTVVLTNSNYSLATATTTTTVDIAKASAQSLANIVDSFKYTVTSGEKAIGTAGMPADAGTLEYVKGTESKTGSVTVSSWAVDANGKVTYTLSGGAENDTITLPVTIKSTNYADSLVNVKLTLTAKDGQAALNYTGGTTVVYGGTLNLTVSGGSGTGAVTYAVTNGTGEATIDGNVLTATKAGEVTVVATKAGDNDYNAVSTTAVTITISKATPTGTPGYTKITTSGKTLGDAALTIGTITPTGGAIAWDLGDAQTVSANTSYSWTYTPADTTNYNVLTGNITPYVVSTGGGGYYPTTYSITMEDTKNGDITVSPIAASKGTTVTITVTPDKGYTLETLTVTDKSGKDVELTKVSSTKYTFKMPASKVTVKATFMDDNTMLNFFVDVPADAYYYDAVLWAVKEGITNGTSATTFSPDDPCTRAQMVTFLWRAAGSPDPKSTTCDFTDVDMSSYYGKAVLWAVEQGITNGTSATTFDPDATCTRAQMATFLCRMADGKPAGNTNAFTDVEAGKYYTEAVQWAVENDITNGTSATTFSPDATCTRAQMVTFLYRYFVK